MGLLGKTVGELAIMATPIYGDVKIHKFWSEDREESKEKIQKIKSIENNLDEREINFKKGLLDLHKKHGIKETMGSLVSFPSNYVAGERSKLGDLSFRSTLAPEMIFYLAKYVSLYACVNTFFR